ncbi:DUF1848 domain-containing protein [Magnetospirillum sulfuroxidans]|uniref:DUF1848 domain-containing protein n=1 Tax=Magnetospirillum sulfuroxidans TaxID=611300 RepID=A0ABS5IDZ6_9PROT|nr:DUF1848 domain-containing protein [Magnetospirillum sulfuroxidans]MBR9972652.1 DUF1848 domain-containing protein [Magnetospirillum sulfuroxidans]
MIVSASYRTDIPAFYAPWFENRFRAGFAKVVNPYGGPPATIALRQNVDGFVFWTRNAQPFVPGLRMVRAADLPFVVSQTVTGYPRALDLSVIAPERAIAHMRELAAEFGPRAVVWRYDPIVFTSLTPVGFHRENFARLAQALAGVVDECVISFATIYKKTARNMDAAARAEGFDWDDPDEAVKRDLAADLARMAAGHGMRLGLCSQPAYAAPGTEAAVCIDARRLEDVAAGWGLRRAIAAKVLGNRPGCACHQSRDIGAYDTCPHGCAYCYAVGSRALAKRRHGGHDPLGDYLFAPVIRDETESLLV